MAYTNAPTQSTYKTLPVMFDGQDYFRTGNLDVGRDVQIKNMYYSRITQENKVREVSLKKRPGLVASTYTLNKDNVSDQLRGYFYDVDQNAFYWAVNDTVYKVVPDVSAITLTVQVLNTSVGVVGFCSFLKFDGTRYVIFSDGTDLWVEDYVAVTTTQVVDPDLPTPHQPYPIYLDGYVFLIKTNTGDLYNSDLDDPTSWTSGDFISAEISSDYALRTVKAKNYLITLGVNSIEYFYNSANATGSPLSRNDSPFRAVGYVTGLITIGDTTYFIGKDNEQNLGVYSVNSFKVERVSNEVVDRSLQVFNTTQNAKGNVYLNRDGYSISIDGKNFYCIVTNQTTWMYDIDDKFWYQWENSSGAGLDIQASWPMYNGHMYVAIGGQTTISCFSQTAYQDYSVHFRTRYTTEKITGETLNWKNCHRTFLQADQHLNTGISNIEITWSDNDWVGATTDIRYINLFNQNNFITRCGRFRTRSIRLEYEDNYPLRIVKLELDVNVQGI